MVVSSGSSHFPTRGRNLRINLGDQIIDENTLTQWEENCTESLRKLEERMKLGLAAKA